DVDQIGQARVDLRNLESRVEAKQQLQDTLLQRLAETNVQEDNDLQRADARIINAAVTPGAPFYPQTRLILIMAFMASLIFGIVLAIALEFMDSGFRSLAQIEAQTNLPTLGMLPALTKKRRDEHPHQFATEKQGSLYAESVRTIRTALMLSNPSRPPKTVLVTSSMPGEGKTSTVLSIACQSVMTGRSCIVIDCDLRQPGLGYALGNVGYIGLGDYLVGHCDLEDIIGYDESTGLDFIGAGTGTVRPVEHLASPRMEKLLQEMAKRYQMVLIDTPPILAVSDALPLLREVDASIFIVRWEKTKRDIAKSGLKLALESGANIAGIVLGNVDVRKHSQYDYADSGYYYHKSYRKYYTS
ncbi:MAG: polysaccharide biosynthesis tyrosine autokinase, partial [Rhodovibrionaceae bacterium]